ncbi:hypothetical protein F8388_006851 [Cannabis sativa]|uniref:Uncharacterized protein n=1 Tax=Cannabis sativa TaxID=3483 RepID=A0A7J6HSX0_CANSA|nr:hypothetical protein F8388_006851 [Cannabis sativa]KAF4397961.1 hypothetical protein G4B88_019682 [Cannabis sativa]
MADAKRALMEGGGNLNQKFSGRLIPKRGQVTMTAVAVLLHSFSSLPKSGVERERLNLKKLQAVFDVIVTGTGRL